jgi:hypothetical protein
MSRFKEKLLGILLLTAILPFQGLLYCFAVAENSGQWSFGDSNNYITDSTIQVAAGAASLKLNNDPVDWYNASWLYRKPITIDNTAGSAELSNYQVKIIISSANFDYLKSLATGADVRLTDSNGTTLLDYWIETWNISGNSVVWVKVPLIPALSQKTVYLYYGNSAATSAESGDDTFMFFDDFDSLTADSYFPLSEAQTVMEFDQLWEDAAPHTLSVLELNAGGYKYWGWYGLQSGGGVGLSRSNDLVNWTKYENNPLFYNGRWPNVMKLGDVFYMVYTKDFGFSPTNLQLATSNDGIHFTGMKTLVPPVAGENNQNPNLFHNPNDGKYYLYWFHGVGSVWNIKVRVADSIEGLDAAETTTILTAGSTLAAPNAMYYNGLYYLSTEIVGPTGWEVKIYTSASPISGFTALPGNPILKDGSACLFQHILGTTMHGYYCKYEVATNTWRLDYRTADLTAPRIKAPLINESKWIASSGAWALKYPETQPDSSSGVVMRGDSGYLKSSYQDDDYIIELSGKQIIGRMWGLGLRLADLANFYAVNLYEDLDNNQNLYLYNISAGSGMAVATANLGVIDPNVWYKMTVKIHADKIDVYINDSLKISGVNTQYTFGNIALINESFTAAYFDNLIVRQYVDSEPAILLGLEDTAYSSGDHLLQPLSFFTFTSLYSFVETATKNGGEIKYVLSNDNGSTWLYYNNDWVSSNNTYGQSNTAAEINANIWTFPSRGQKFLFQAFLHSNGAQFVSLDNVAVTGGFASGSRAFLIASNPKSSIIEPLSNQSFTLAPIEIKGTSLDNKKISSIQKVEISTDGGATWFLTEPVSSNDDYGFTWKYDWNPPKEGSYILKTRATDWMNNIETPGIGVTVTVSADVVAPTITASLTIPVILTSTPATTITVPYINPIGATEIQANVVYIQQQIIVLIQQLIAQLLVELQAIR